MLIRTFPALLFLLVFVPGDSSRRSTAQAAAPAAFGYIDFAKEAASEAKFLDVPSARLAGEELKSLTAAPHLASTPEDHRTAEYVAEKFRAAGLATPNSLFFGKNDRLLVTPGLFEFDGSSTK